MNFSESENFNAESIAEEAEHLRLVLGQIREQIDILENDGFSYRVINFYDEQEVEEYRTEKFRHDERQRDIKILKRALDTPYFSRMKLVCVGEVEHAPDVPSMTHKRALDFAAGPPTDDEIDIYVGAGVVVYKDRIIVFSHNSPLGNKVYERFEGGEIEYGGFVYKVIFRRKFDIRGGKLEAMFQDYSAEAGGVVYDKFLAHMLEVKRGDKRLTDIIPTIQANQNAIIVRPADENCVVAGCAGCGKTMLLLQRLEYLSFNKRIELGDVYVIAPSERYVAHIQPVVDDLMINAARRLTMPELYRELILSMRGVKGSVRRELNGATPIGDEGLPTATVVKCYSDELKRKLITSLGPVRQSYRERMIEYRKALEKYEREHYGLYYDGETKKPTLPVVTVDLKKFPFIPELGGRLHKCKLYLLLTAYCYILGKPDFDKALFVDEGQDYFLNEYRLLAECTKAVVNIYGDTNQQLESERGIGDFTKLDALWSDMQHYALNENYRNACEITEYVNATLGMNVTSLGLSGGAVKRVKISELERLLSDVGDDRTAVIYPERDKALEKRLAEIVPADNLYTVAQSKGMEYERVYVCGELSDTEKYVAYTRALVSLYICE